MNKYLLPLFITPLLILALLTTNSNAQNPVIAFNTFSSSYSYPVGIYNCGDSRLFILEQTGRVYICDLNGVKNTTPFLDIHTVVSQSVGEQGLLGMAFHPNYSTNGYVYVNYIDNSGNTKISRFTRNPGNANRLDETTELVLMTITQPYANHNGGCMNFGKDGFLYIAMGDGGSQGDPQARAQDNTQKLGKILRINVNSGSTYSIPASNPYYGVVGVVQEIWSKGFRNPWRWSFDSYTGDMWIGDVGQYLYEEINFQPGNSSGGDNYGWRCYEGNHSYNLSVNCPAAGTLIFPVYEYAHSSTSGCSVTGGYVYRGGLYGELFGKYLFSDYCSGLMRMITKNGTTFTETDLNDLANNEIVSFGEDRYGELYACFYSSGAIKKMSSSGCSPTAFIKGNSTVSPCANTTYTLEAFYSPGLTYQWYKNNVLISGAVSSNYDVTANGNYKVVVNKTGGCSATSNVIKVAFSPTAKITASGPVTFCAGGSVTLSAATGTGYSYQWKKNNVNINGATQSTYIATQSGNYKVKVTDAKGCTKVSGMITVTVNCKQSAEWQPENISADVFPNPANGLATIQLNAKSNEHYKISLTDLLGKNRFEEEVRTDDEGFSQLMIDVSLYAKGIYYVSISNNADKQFLKLLVH